MQPKKYIIIPHLKLSDFSDIIPLHVRKDAKNQIRYSQWCYSIVTKTTEIHKFDQFCHTFISLKKKPVEELFYYYYDVISFSYGEYIWNIFFYCSGIYRELRYKACMWAYSRVVAPIA